MRQTSTVANCTSDPRIVCHDNALHSAAANGQRLHAANQITIVKTRLLRLLILDAVFLTHNLCSPRDARLTTPASIPTISARFTLWDGAAGTGANCFKVEGA